MKRGSIIFLQFVIVLIGIGVLAFLLWVPQVEGVNANATNFEIYFKDPLLAYGYVGSIFFFTALYQAFRLLGYVARKEVFSPRSVRALRIIKRSLMVFIAFILGGEAYIFVFVRGTDDHAGGVMMGLFLIFVSSVVATAAAVFEKTLQSAVEIKSENDLTV
jgi:hypothetical protein